MSSAGTRANSSDTTALVQSCHHLQESKLMVGLVAAEAARPFLVAARPCPEAARPCPEAARREVLEEALHRRRLTEEKMNAGC